MLSLSPVVPAITTALRLVPRDRRIGKSTLREAAAAVRAGETIIFPTETVYGIGCDPDSEAAVAKVFAAKRRAGHKPLAIHLAAAAHAAHFAAFLSPAAERLMNSLWPGPLAIVVQRRSQRCAAAALKGPTISLRAPSDPLAQSLLAATGPLAATSANMAGAPPFVGDPDQIRALPRCALAIIAGRTLYARESTIVDCSGEEPRLIREGAMPAAALADALGYALQTGPAAGGPP